MYITTPDGKDHWVMDNNGVMDLIKEYCGYDMYMFFEGYDGEMRKLRQEIDDLRDELEGTYEEEAMFLVDIRDTIDELRSKPRLDRRELNKKLDYLYDEINGRL